MVKIMKNARGQETRATSKQMQQNNGIQKLIDDVIAYGDLLEIANKGIGKTNALMCLARELGNLENTRVIIFEDFPKWCKQFDSLPYMIIRDDDVSESNHVLDMEDYFLRHERDYTVFRGEEIEQFLENTKDCIFTMEIADVERTCFFIYSIVQYFYRKAYLRAYKGYGKTERVIFVIEESQNVFDSSTVSKKIFNRLRKIFSVARNLDLHFVLASQRLQDLNTKIRGRTRLLIGQVSLDDWELKVRRLLRNSKYQSEILEFERGKFLYTATDTVVKMPLFEQNGKPWEYVPTVIEQPTPTGFIAKLKALVTKNNDKVLEQILQKVR